MCGYERVPGSNRDTGMFNRMRHLGAYFLSALSRQRGTNALRSSRRLSRQANGRAVALLAAFALTGCALTSHTIQLPAATGRAQLTYFSAWPTLCGVVVEDAQGKPIYMQLTACLGGLPVSPDTLVGFAAGKI